VNLNQVHRGAGAEALGTECFLKRAIVTAWGTGLRRLFCEACIVLRCGSLTSEDEKEKRGRRSPCGSVEFWIARSRAWRIEQNFGCHTFRNSGEWKRSSM
jgi:hypothetical protein